MSVIYKITNLINNKIYVGKDVKNRSYYYGSGKVLKFAIKKYGKENFKKEIIEECDKEQLSKREVYWIKKLRSNTANIGYNLTSGGEGGDTFTNNLYKKEINEKRSKSLKGKLSGEKNPSKRTEVRQRISKTLKSGYSSGRIIPPMLNKTMSENPNTGQKRTRKQKERMSIAQQNPIVKLKKSYSLKKTWQNKTQQEKDEIYKKISDKNTGQKRTKEQNESNRQAQIKRFSNIENRKKASISQQIRFQNETTEQKEERIHKLKLYYQNKEFTKEERKKRSDTMKKRYQENPELKDKISGLRLNKPRSERVKQKISEGLKKYHKQRIEKVNAEMVMGVKID